jgi:hypothetical protein
MPMELYSSEAFVRDIANAISKSEGRPLNIGGTRHQGIDRDYAYQLITEAKKAIEGNFGQSAAGAASKAGPSRGEAVKKLLAKLDRKDAMAKTPRKRVVKKPSSRNVVKAVPRTVASRGRRAPAS